VPQLVFKTSEPWQPHGGQVRLLCRSAEPENLAVLVALADPTARESEHESDRHKAAAHDGQRQCHNPRRNVCDVEPKRERDEREDELPERSEEPVDAEEMAEVLRSDPHTVVIPPWMSHRLFVRQDSRPVDPHAAKGDGGQVRLLCRSVARKTAYVTHNHRLGRCTTTLPGSGVGGIESGRARGPRAHAGPTDHHTISRRLAVARANGELADPTYISASNLCRVPDADFELVLAWIRGERERLRLRAAGAEEAGRAAAEAARQDIETRHSQAVAWSKANL
jgi:hypothetical protein